MKTRAMILALTVALAAAATAATLSPPAALAQTTPPSIPIAIADTRRPEADRARDADRMPADLLAFAQIAPGQKVVDMLPGAGYVTRLFSVAVGPAGRVYTAEGPVNPERPSRVAPFAAEYGNIQVTNAPFAEMSFPEPVDLIWTSLNYHDLYRRDASGLAAINQAVFNALKPGGVYIVIDHAAAEGAEPAIFNELHRIPESVVRQQVEAVGFVFDASSDALRHPQDNRSARVFEGDVRGRTDQFMMRFRKPG